MNRKHWHGEYVCGCKISPRFKKQILSVCHLHGEPISWTDRVARGRDPEKVKLYDRTYYWSHKDEIKDRGKQYRETHAVQEREYRDKNRAHRNEVKKAYRKRKREEYLRENPRPLKKTKAPRFTPEELKLRRHGLSKVAVKEYQAWCSMKKRCFNPKNHKYSLYGGRGITVCDEWRDSFKAFFDHLGMAPKDRPVLDRINVNGNYEPGNVRWTTYKISAHNQRRRLSEK